MRAVVLDSRRPALPALALVGAVLANAVIGIGVAAGHRVGLLVALLALAPALLLALGSLVESHRATLAWVALALNFTGLPFVSEPLPLPGSVRVYLADLVLLLALGAWAASALSRVEARNPVRLSTVFRIPFALFALTIGVGIVLGNLRYGTTIVGQPLRLVLYAAIALALTDLTPHAAWRSVTTVFYAGACVQLVWALYYLATGGSQTASDVLSTGGVRILALSIAIYLTGSLVCALLNLERERMPGRQLLHAAIAAISLFGIVVSFGRTTYAAVVLILPLLLATRRYLRRALLWLLPLVLPALVAATLVLVSSAPGVVETLENRLLGTSGNDSAVEWRQRAIAGALEGIGDDLLTGLGFGRESRFVANDELVVFRGDPENSYVWILAGAGLCGLASFLVLCGTYVVDCLRRIRGTDEVGQALVIWSLATWTAFMVNALTGPIFADPEMLLTIWVLMALPSCVTPRQRRPLP